MFLLFLQASSDFEFYRKVLNCLMEILTGLRQPMKRRPSSPSSSRRGGAKRRRRGGSSDSDDQARRSRPKTPREVMRELQNFVDAAHRQYRHLCKCVTERRPLHSHVYFSPEVRRACAGDARACAEVANALMAHFGAKRVDERSVARRVRELREKEDLKKGDAFKKECRTLVMNKLGLAPKEGEDAEAAAKRLPEPCRPLYRLLSGVLVKHFEEPEEHSCQKLSSAILALEAPRDETNGLQDLQNFFVRVLASVLKKMTEDGEVEGASFQSMSLEPVLRLAAKWTEELLERGFLLFGAYQSLLDGTLAQDLKALLERGGKTPGKALSSALLAQAVSRLCCFWVERSMKKLEVDRFPCNKQMSKTLKHQVAVLLRTTAVVKSVAEREKLVINLHLPAPLVHAIKDINMGINQQVSLPEGPQKPQANAGAESNDTTLTSADDEQDTTAEVKSEAEPHSPETGELFIDRPGTAVAGRPITVEPKKSVMVKLWLCGHSRIRRRSQLTITPDQTTKVNSFKEKLLIHMKVQTFFCSPFQVLHGIEVTAPDDGPVLLPGFQVLAHLQNSGDEAVTVPMGTVLAKVQLKDKGQEGVLLPPLPAEQYAMVRVLFQVFDMSRIISTVGSCFFFAARAPPLHLQVRHSRH